MTSGPWDARIGRRELLAAERGSPLRWVSRAAA
jgi:hypothetical protein